jgi:hypothetical protein
MKSLARGVCEPVLEIDGKEVPFSVSTSILISVTLDDGSVISHEISSSSKIDIYDALREFATIHGAKPPAIPLDESKLWKGLVRFSGDTSFSSSAGKPNSSKTWG